MAEIEGDESGNTLTGTAGSDTISGKGGDDSIDGGDGEDTLFGGAGNDTITGGGDEDFIVGGAGDDVMSAGSGSPTDTFFIRDGHGSDVITDFDPSEPDMVRFDMVEMSSFQDVLDRASADGDDTVITYDNGDTLRLVDVDPADLTSTNFEFSAGPVCLAEGTMIRTPIGLRRIETLRPGDMVQTLHHGPQKITSVFCEAVTFKGTNDRRRPILIARNALGTERPKIDLVVSPQHRVFFAGLDVQEDMLVAAVKLVKRPGIRRMRGCKSIRYFNILMECHEVIWANNCAVETLLVTPYNLLRLRALQPSIVQVTSTMRSVCRIAERDPKGVLEQA